MNTRIVLSAVLAASLVFAPALISAQAPPSLNSQTPQAKIESLQAQVQALQAQVKNLQAQLRAKSPSPVAGPQVQMPFFTIPNLNGQGGFGGQGFGGGFNGQGFGGQGRFAPDTLLPAPRLYWNIPPCTVTLIGQKPR